MTATDELREFAESLAIHRDTIDMMLAIADRIDAEHRAALEKLSALIDEDSDQYLEGFNYAMDHLADETNKLTRRVERIERLLTHKTREDV